MMATTTEQSPVLSIFHSVLHKHGVPPSFTSMHESLISLLATPLNHSHLTRRFPEAMAGAANIWCVPDDKGAAHTTRE